MSQSQAPQRRLSPDILFFPLIFQFFFLPYPTWKKKSLSSIRILLMEPCAHQDDRKNDVGLKCMI